MQLPRALLEPILYSAMVFWIAGLFGGVAGFIQFCIPVIACAVTATAWGNVFLHHFVLKYWPFINMYAKLKS